MCVEGDLSFVILKYTKEINYFDYKTDICIFLLAVGKVADISETSNNSVISTHNQSFHWEDSAVLHFFWLLLRVTHDTILFKTN